MMMRLQRLATMVAVVAGAFASLAFTGMPGLQDDDSDTNTALVEEGREEVYERFREAFGSADAGELGDPERAEEIRELDELPTEVLQEQHYEGISEEMRVEGKSGDKDVEKGREERFREFETNGRKL